MDREQAVAIVSRSISHILFKELQVLALKLKTWGTLQTTWYSK